VSGTLSTAGHDAPQACESGKVSKLCSCALAEAFRGEVTCKEKFNDQDSCDRNRKKAPGFKYMLDHHELEGTGANKTGPPMLHGLVASVCDLRVPFVIYLRRNVLRRVVSKESMHWGSHVDGEAKAAALRKKKPALDAGRLEKYIRAEQSDYGVIKKLFQFHCGGEWDVDRRIHYYEDLVDANPLAKRNWGEVLYELGAFNTSNATEIERQLGGWPMDRGTIIHGKLPVLDTVANPADVKAALEGTSLAWMLEGR